MEAPRVEIKTTMGTFQVEVRKRQRGSPVAAGALRRAANAALASSCYTRRQRASCCAVSRLLFAPGPCTRCVLGIGSLPRSAAACVACPLLVLPGCSAAAAVPEARPPQPSLPQLHQKHAPPTPHCRSCTRSTPPPPPLPAAAAVPEARPQDLQELSGAGAERVLRWYRCECLLLAHAGLCRFAGPAAASPCLLAWRQNACLLIALMSLGRGTR